MSIFRKVKEKIAIHDKWITKKYARDWLLKAWAWMCCGGGYPKSLDSFFMTGRCPDCGSEDFWTWQDGGHDQAIECKECHSKFGLQNAPFCLIERIGRK